MGKDNRVEKKRQINIKVDQEFFTAVKVKAAKEGISLQALVEKLLKRWLDGKSKV
jgi:predicted DNA binding CopG/RHH family protein